MFKKKNRAPSPNKRRYTPYISKRKLADLIDFGTGSAGSGVATLVGGVIAGPVGGIAGGITAIAVQKMLKKFISKHVSPNLSISEEHRLEMVLLHFNTKMIQNLSVGSGTTLRQDCFFSTKINERSAAEEIFGILIAAQREHEEKKVKFEGNFFANIAYYPSADKAKANFLLRLARELSYTQLCIVALLVKKDRFHLRDTSYREIERLYDFNIVGLLQEIYILYSQGLIFILDAEALAGPLDIIPAKMEAQGPIKELYVLMGLDEIEQTDINKIAEQLSMDRQVG